MAERRQRVRFGRMPAVLAGLGALALAACTEEPADLAGPAPPPAVERAAAAPPAPRLETSYKGQLLVAAPGMRDPRFAKTVIFMVEHNAEGALGLVVNKVIGTGPIGDMMRKLGVEGGDAGRELRVHYGGPVELKFAFVLHSNDYKGVGSRVVNEKYALTSRTEVLVDIAKGQGPRRSLFALGYAGWGPGQLESEMKRRDWVVIPADDALIFGDDTKGIWDRAIARRSLEL